MLAALLAGARLLAQESPAGAAARIDALLAKSFPADAPGAAVIVVHQGEVVLRRGYGSANLELGVPLKPEHVFRIGSITKQFTAVAILQLVEAGKLRLDDDITTYVPEVQTGGKRITLTHLLTHTSGLPSFTDQAAWRAAAREDMTLEKELGYIRDLPLQFAPGTDWAYCNTGYRLLGAVIEKVTGQSYADYVQARIFAPAGMTHSSYDETLRVMPLRVPGYSARQGGVVTHAPYVSMTQPHGAGALLSNVDDLWRWQQAQDAGKLVDRALLAQAHTAARLADGRDAGYGFGWSVSVAAGWPCVEHGGGIQGFVTHALSVPEARFFVAVLCNSDRPKASPAVLTTQIAEIVLGAKGAAPAAEVPAEVLQGYAGVYRAPFEKIAFAVEDGQFVVKDQGGRTFALTALSATQFFAPKIQMRYTFVDDPERAGRKRLRLKPRGKPESFARPVDEPLRDPAADVPVATLERYAGNYELRPGFVLAVKRDGSGLTAQATGQGLTTLVAETATRFRVQQVAATIEFQADAAGEVTGLVLNQNGRALPGKRVP